MEVRQGRWEGVVLPSFTRWRDRDSTTLSVPGGTLNNWTPCRGGRAGVELLEFPIWGRGSRGRLSQAALVSGSLPGEDPAGSQGVGWLGRWKCWM